MRKLLPGLFLAALACAADIKPLDAKPGLWESTTTTEMQGMAIPAMPSIPKETLDKMPPAQRAKIEEMMKARGSAGAPNTMTSKACQTKESLAQGYNMPSDKAIDCKRDVITSTSTKLQMHLVCTPAGGGPTMNTDATFERLDAEHVKGNMVTKMDMQGKPVTSKITISSKWISSDCGSVKPYIAK